MKFSMEIKFGNTRMLTDEDLSDAIADVSRKIKDFCYVEHVIDRGAGNIARKVLDRNGNAVGKFVISYED